ncbi:MAG: hypothetical protein ACFFD4_30415 [Candidatus Odinarchaeota archaeon]
MGFKVYQAMADGGHVEIRYRGEKTFKNNEVFVIEDEDSKRIFIWIGSEAPVRMKFISSQIASQIRMTLGLTYKISTMEQGLEVKEFWEVLGSQPPVPSSPVEPEMASKVPPSVIVAPETPIPLDQQIEQLEKKAPKETTPIKAPISGVKRPVRSTERPQKIDKPAKSLMTQLEEKEASLEHEPEVYEPVSPAVSTSAEPAARATAEVTVLQEQEKIVRDFVQMTIESSPVNLKHFHESSVEESETVSKNRARRIIDNRTIETGKTVILNRIFISIKETVDGGTLEFFSSMNSDEEEDCAYRAPICKIFLHEKQTGSYLLHIVVPQGASLYYTCPGGIFFSLMFAEI